MKSRIFLFCLMFVYAYHMNGQYTVKSYDDSVTCAFGNLPYRVYYPQELTASDTTHVIHVSVGGNGNGDDRGTLLAYVYTYVQAGYVVVQVDHRYVGDAAPISKIAEFRGQEIKCISSKVANDSIRYGGFSGHIDGSRQGYAGHSGGCMEGLEAAGTKMYHGNYYCPAIKAVYGMSPAGYKPDQFGIDTVLPGYAAIDSTAIFVIMGEEEVNVNGPGQFMAKDWRRQPYKAMNEKAPRYEAYVKGSGTTHNDIAGLNAGVRDYNSKNSLAFFDVYVKNKKNRLPEIGTLSLPPSNPVEFSSKGLLVNPPQYVLTVVNGTGSGSYAEGTKVIVRANAASSGKLFDKWTGDVAYLKNENDSVNEVTMPAKNITITAMYKDSPAELQQIDKSVVVYPNPTTDHLTVSVPEGTSCRITVINECGEVVLDDMMKADNMLLNVSQWVKGMYVIKIVSENQIINKKVLVQ